MQGTNLRQSVRRSIVTGFALAAGVVATANAQRPVFQWSGRVDNDIQLIFRGNAFLATRIGSDERVSQGASKLTALPAHTGELSLRVLEGRGDVEIKQQPTPESGYTAVIRIHDPGPGMGTYKLDVYWQAAAAGEVVAIVPPIPYPVSSPVLARERAREMARRAALVWSGDVDSELEIVVRPSGVTYETIRGRPPHALQSALNQMPWPNAELAINQIEGRGEAYLVQQPTAENGFTARIRVRDPQPGFGHYVFMALWR
jgi:hypothetical protein